jgi:single-stranded DNA-specific DHH superfamily exonuclease
MAAYSGLIKDLMDETHKDAESIQKNVENGRNILVVSHMDTDVISAAGILGTAFSIDLAKVEDRILLLVPKFL